MKKKQLLGLLIVACTVLVLPYIQIEAHSWYMEKGLASWYGKAHAGRLTTSGKPFSPQEMTAAHRQLPLTREPRCQGQCGVYTSSNRYGIMNWSRCS